MTRIDPTSSRFVDDQADSGEKTYATFNHLAGLIGLVDGMGVVSFISTLVMWRIKSKESPFLDDHGREAVNFQISMSLLLLAGWAVWGLFVAVTIGIGIITLPLPLLATLGLFIVRLVAGIRASMAANRGEFYRYPMCIRFIASPDESKQYACDTPADTPPGPIA
jgi:hypothetical protein